MPTIDEMWKETKKNMREAKNEMIGRDKEILQLRAKSFKDLFKYMDRATLPKKADVEFFLGRSKRWIEIVKKVPKKGTKK